jgi:chaperonin GroES
MCGPWGILSSGFRTCRASVARLKGLLALAHCDCQSRNITKAKEDRMKFRPLHDRVVVKRIDAEEKTAGGIIIPDTAKEKPSQGEITAVGPGGRDEAGKLIPIDLKVGDCVLFGKWSGTEVKLDGEELLIMKESDIMGVLEGKKAKK